MVRAFTISFAFEGKTYLALASMKTISENEEQYYVRIYDDALARIIPERSVSYTSNRPLCPSSLNHPQALKLFSCINKAVDYHLQVSKRSFK
jgi:hypothetical protein